MKTLKLLSLLVCVILCGLTSDLFSQDVIFLSNGNEIEAKIIKIGDSEIEYKKWSNQEGPTYTEKTSNIFMIKYQNGEKEIIENKQNDVNKDTEVVAESNADLSIQQIGNKLYYQGREINGEEDVLEIFKENNCNDAYNTYKDALGQYNAGKTCYWIGYPLFFVGGILTGVGFGAEEYTLLAIGAPMAAAGLPLFIAGYSIMSNASKKSREVLDTYNNHFVKKNNDISLNLGISSTGGIGLSLRF